MTIDGGLRGIFKDKLPGDWQPIESGLTGGGIPDANYCIDGAEGWVEFKKTDGWAVRMRPEQIGWIFKRVLNGGRVHIAVRRKHEELWLVPGSLVRVLASEGLKNLEVDTWTGGPNQWDWTAIERRLTAPLHRRN